MLVQEKMSIYFTVKFYVCACAHLRRLKTQKSCAAGMHNAILRNHLEDDKYFNILSKLQHHLGEGTEGIFEYHK